MKKIFALTVLMSIFLGLKWEAMAQQDSMSVPLLEQYVLDLMNNERTAAGLPAYTRDTNMDNAARAHSELWLMLGSCPSQGIWPDGHICPGESDPCTRIINALGAPVMSCAENVGQGYDLSPTPNYYNIIQGIHTQFMAEGPSGGFNHYDNIMSSTFDRVGVGVAINAGNIRFTVDFAKE
jgi:uncharacterized protein YkwD